MARSPAQMRAIRDEAVRLHEMIDREYRIGHLTPLEAEWCHDQVTAQKIEAELRGPTIPNRDEK